MLATKDGKHLRGLSKSKICIVVAIDQYQNMIAIISGHGKPSSKRTPMINVKVILNKETSIV